MAVEGKSGIQHDKLRMRGDEFTSYDVPEDTIVDVIPSLRIYFWTGFGMLDLATCLF